MRCASRSTASSYLDTPISGGAAKAAEGQLSIMASDAPEAFERAATVLAGCSWIFENRVPRILDGDYTPHSAVDIFVKDLHIVQEKAANEHFPLPMATAASQLFTMATSMGMGRLDDSAVAKVYESMSNIALPQPKETD